jgi:hypothetical protein
MFGKLSKRSRSSITMVADMAIHGDGFNDRQKKNINVLEGLNKLWPKTPTLL